MHVDLMCSEVTWGDLEKCLLTRETDTLKSESAPPRAMAGKTGVLFDSAISTVLYKAIRAAGEPPGDTCARNSPRSRAP